MNITKLAFQIADEAAESWLDSFGERPEPGWLSAPTCNCAVMRRDWLRAVRYLTARKRIESHPKHKSWKRVKA